MARMSNKLVALCSAAVGLVYVAGYVVTLPLVQDSTTVAATLPGLPDSSANAAPGVEVPAPATLAPAPQPVSPESQPPAPAATAPAPQPMPAPQPTPAAQPKPAPQPKPAQPKPAPRPTPAPPPAPKQKYKDGTYVGVGTNRIGDIQVTLTLKADKIVDVRVTDCTTHYPCDLVAPMPQEVLDRQSDQVDWVSGATKSSRDFQTAVDLALAQAMAAAAH